ncbi:hypothetical protein QGM71_14065 [Virgibacillus sp. C22-A2]|uniref:Methyl-accepting transducer domain-containing protein n=1 Tax=Virgibacillus tibetensis TaxID=3042313 RepID=A0ABU6KJN5_9BACI|nr:hypothetical protein [Virgibacillus sp. C22-A2]
MKAIDALKLSDTRKKNIFVLIAFSISIVSAFILTIVQADFSKSIFYGIELIVLLTSYLIVKYMVKNDMIYKYVLVIAVYGFIFASIILFGGELTKTLILFFLLFLSTVHLTQSVFLIGYLTGFVLLILNALNATAADVDMLQSNLAATLLTYLLAGIMSFMLIHMNRKQFKHTEELLLTSEKDAEIKEIARKQLEKNVNDIIAKVKSVNIKVQGNIESQSEITEAIAEVATGSTVQNERITDIAQSSQDTLQQIVYILDETKVLKGEFEKSAKIAVNGNSLSKGLSTNMAEFSLHIDELSQAFESLSSKISETNTFSQDIINVSQQTNLSSFRKKTPSSSV